MSRHRQKSGRREVVISDDEISEKFYSKDRSSHRSPEISKRSEIYKKSKRSDRREITSNSDDDNLEKISSKDKYSYTSDTSKRTAKHKKSKKASKKQSDSSSESEDEYDSRKENKTGKKHKKKSSKDKYEKKSDKGKFSKDSVKFRSDEAYGSDSSEKVDSSKNSRKRNRSQEKQRYGKWAEGVNKNKDKSDLNDDTMSYESKSKRTRTDDFVDGQKRNKRKNDSDSEERPTNYHQRRKTDYDNSENYQSNSRLNREERPDKYSKSRLESKDERKLNREERPDKYSKSRLESNDEHKLNREERPDKYSKSRLESNDEHKLNREERPDRYSKSRLESSDERSENGRRYNSSKYEERNRYPESDKHYRRDSDRYDRKERREFDRERNRDDYYEESQKMPRKPYVDLDDPNQRKEENRVEDNESNNKSQDEEKVSKKFDDVEPLSKRLKIGNINTRTGGAYIPPARLRMMQEKIKDKGSEEYQRIAWEALKKSIVGMTNKVNSSNISDIVIDLFKENIIRGRGVLARAIMQAQGASPTFTRVYAALVCVINTKFPEIGELILKRLIIQYKRGFRRNDKTICMNATRFVAHLLNQEVAHEVLILEMVTHLLENPTEDSIEIAIATLKECGKKLTQLSARGMRAITQRVRNVLHEGNVDARVRYMIEVFFAVQKDGFKDFEIVPKELDLVEDEDKYTHFLNLDDAVDTQDMLNVFKFDPDYIENEEKYKSVAKEILGDSDEEEGSAAESGSEGGEEEEEEEKTEESQQIIDMTETNIVCLRRKIYLTIQSSLDFEECAHKLLKLELKPGQILEMCYMILDCCAQQRTYEKFFGLLGQRFCQLNKIYVEPFTEIFENSYKTIHRLETNKLRNVAKFFAHLLYTDAISWNVLSIIKLNENDTTSSSRIFIKILFQELSEYMSLAKLNERVKDVTLQEAFDGLFPRDLPHNTRFAINFFTSIGLGGLTDELREHLKNLPKTNTLTVAEQLEKEDSASSSSSASDSSSTSSSSSDSDSD